MGAVKVVAEQPCFAVFIDQGHRPKNRGFRQGIRAKVEQPGNAVGQSKESRVSFGSLYVGDNAGDFPVFAFSGKFNFVLKDF